MLIKREVHVCGLLVRVPSYRSRNPVSIPGLPEFKIVGLEWGPLSLVEIYEELKPLRSLVRKRTIPTDRPPVVDEVSANFSG
jgi:hypothetical protein